MIGSTNNNPVASTITGTANEVIVTNSAGSITLSSPQAIGPTSDVTFNSEILSNLNINGAVYSDGSKKLQSNTMTNGQLLIGLSVGVPSNSTLTGTTNQVIVSNAPNSITLSLPPDIATTSSSTFF